ncbi:MAG: hypothetical protein WAV73_05910 [Candidatus Moraniibacteriota bacterium]
MNIKKSLVRKNKSAKISLVVLSIMLLFGAANIAHGEDSGCTPDYSCAASTCLLDTCVDPNCGQIIYGQNTDQACMSSMPCTQTLAGPIGNCTGNPTTPTNPGSPTPTDPTQSGGSGGKASADALTKPGDLLVYMATYGTSEGEAKYLAECQIAYSQIQADLTAQASDTNWYSEYIAEIKVRNMSAFLEETVENMGDGLSGQGAIDFVNKYVNPILTSKNLLPYSSAETTVVMAKQTGNGTSLNDDRDKLTASKISGMFSNTARYNTNTSPNVSGTYGSREEAEAVLIANGYHDPMCIPQALPDQSQLSCYWLGGIGATLVNYSLTPNEWIIYSSGTGAPVGTTPTTTPTGTPALSASVTSGAAPLNNVSFTLTNGTNCINYRCGDGLFPTGYIYERSFTCDYATAGNYVASIECGTNKIEKTITVTDSTRTSPTTPSGTPSFSASTTSGPAPLDVSFTLTNGANCINYMCGVGFGASVYDVGKSFSCHYPTAGSYVASIECGGSKIEKTITVTDLSRTSPTTPSGTPSFSASATSGTAPLNVNFTLANGTGCINYLCSPGVGTQNFVYEQSFSCSYPTAGSYVASIECGGNKIEKTITVTNDAQSLGTSPTCSASFSPTGFTSPGTAYLTFNSSGADKLIGVCTGTWPVPEDNYGLSYTNYPFPFTAGQYGTETCTFTPYKGTTRGASCSANLTVGSGTSRGVNSTLEMPETPTVNPPSGKVFTVSPGQVSVTSNNAVRIYYTSTFSTDGNPPANDPLPYVIDPNRGVISGSAGTINLQHKGGVKTIYKLRIQAENSNGAGGAIDVSYEVTGNTAPTNPDSTSCASQTCSGVTCYDGANAVRGTKTSGCATVTASFNPSRINSAAGSQPTSAEISYLTWSSSGASKVEIFCDGPTFIPRTNWFLNTAAWYNSQTAYQKTATTPDGYPGWFPRGTSDIETCTFYPTNSIDGKAGTPFSASINVVNPSSSGTDCECSNNLAFSGGSACTGGTCDGCHCVYSGTPPATPPPATTGGDTSAYKSIMQFQQSLCQRDSAGYCSSYVPIVTGFKNAFPPSTNSAQSEQRFYRTVFGYTAESNSVRISYSEGEMDKFKVYIPASATDINLTLYNSQRNGSGAYLYAVARSGETPQGDYSDISQLDNASSAAGTLSDITNRDNVTSFSGGMTRILDGPVNNFQGGWVYVKIIRSNVSIGSISFSTTVNSQNYPTWYNGLTTNNGWLADGDPAEIINSEISSPGRGPTPTGAAVCGNAILENQEECDYTSSSQAGSYAACPTGKTCQNCTCVNASRATVCQPDNSDCAAHTCDDIYCFDGCERKKGTKNCP